MTKEEAISLAKSYLTEEMKSRSSSGDAVRIDRDYVATNAEWLGKIRAESSKKLGIPFPPIDEAAIVPHWFVTFTVFAPERKPVEGTVQQPPIWSPSFLKHLGFNIYDEGTVQQPPIWSPSFRDALGLDDQGSASNAT